MLNQILWTSGRRDQNRLNSSRYPGVASMGRVTVQCTVMRAPPLPSHHCDRIAFVVADALVTVVLHAIVETGGSRARVAANDGDVNRSEAADDGGVHQIRAAIIGKPAECDQRSEVFGLVRIASGAMQRRFPGNLEGEKGRVSAEDAGPNAQNLPVLQASPFRRREYAGPGSQPYVRCAPVSIRSPGRNCPGSFPKEIDSVTAAHGYGLFSLSR